MATQFRRRLQTPDVGSGDLGARLPILAVIHAAGADLRILDEREPRTVGAASLPLQRLRVAAVHLDIGGLRGGLIGRLRGGLCRTGGLRGGLRRLT